MRWPPPAMPATLSLAIALRLEYRKARIIMCGDDDWLTRPGHTGRLDPR